MDITQNEKNFPPVRVSDDNKTFIASGGEVFAINCYDDNTLPKWFFYEQLVSTNTSSCVHQVAHVAHANSLVFKPISIEHQGKYVCMKLCGVLCTSYIILIGS